MTIAVQKALRMTFFAVLLMTLAFPLMAQVYKVVDENGNVSYTDQPPGDGSKPIKLAPISVIEAPEYEKAPEVENEGEEGDEKQPSLSYLRRIYKDFSIISPVQEESVWKPNGPVAVAWNVRTALQPGMKVTLYLDGAEHVTTVESIIPLSNLDRGEHILRAELKNSKNQVVATAPTVTFFVRQPNLYSTPRVGSGGG